MITVDNLLIQILNSNTPVVEELISARDCRVLRSIAQNIYNGHYITENQSKLILKILKENADKLPDFSQDIKTSLISPSWNRSFRHVEQIKKIYMEKDDEGDPNIVVEFSFNSEIRKTINELTKKSDDMMIQVNGKKYSVELTEKNVTTLIDELIKFDFTIDETLQTYYDTIKSWSEKDVKEQFAIGKIEYKNFQKAITDDLGLYTSIDKNIIQDRSMRYRYINDTYNNFGETLTEVIANRSKTRVYIDKNQHSLSEVIKSLIELKRLPLLVVFDNAVNNKYVDNISTLSNALKDNQIYDHVGVYFRLSNDEMGKKFNTIIAENQYNSRLDNSLQVAAVMSGKLPKFFLTNAWRPMSIISLDSRMGLRHGKTSVYANCCDCIVEWADEPVMICLLYTSPSPRDGLLSRMPSSA